MPKPNSAFDDLSTTPNQEPSQDALSLVISTLKLGVQQKLFNDLLAKIEKTNQDIEALRRLEIRHAPERDKKLRPLETQTQELYEQLVRTLDQRLQESKGLSKKQFSDLGYVAAVLADSLSDVAEIRGRPLSADFQSVVDRLREMLDDDDSESDVDRHFCKQGEAGSHTGFDAETQAPEELIAMLMQQMQNMQEQREAAQQAHQAKRDKLKKTSKQLKEQQESLDADTALRTIYRKLASALHPDREPDEAERIRKTQLMGQVNAANDAKDLLTLLRLQLQIEQIEPTAIATMADDKLKSFNRMLKEQAKTAQEALQKEQWRLREKWELLSYKPINLQQVEATLRGKMNGMRSRNASMQQDLVMMRDSRFLNSWIKEQIRLMEQARGNDQDWS